MTALELVKSRLKSREALYLIMDDVRSKKVLVGWMKYYPACRDFSISEKDGKNPAGLLAALWESVGRIDFTALSNLAGLPASRAQRIFERLRAVHLVWPDGTIDENALTLIQTEVGISLSGVVRQARQAARPRPA